MVAENTEIEYKFLLMTTIMLHNNAFYEFHYELLEPHRINI